MSEFNSAVATLYAGTEIAIIGMAGKFPGAKDINEFWDNLCNSKEAVTWFEKPKIRDLKMMTTSFLPHFWSMMWMPSMRSFFNISA